MIQLLKNFVRGIKLHTNVVNSHYSDENKCGIVSKNKNGNNYSANRSYTKKWPALIVILAGIFLVVTDLFSANLILPFIKESLETSDTAMQFVMASYFLGYAFFLMTGARMGDHFGRRRMMRSGLFMFMISSIFCAVSTSSLLLIVARFFEGISAALLGPQCISLIQVLFKPGNERTKAFGFYGITAGLSCIFGLFMGGFVTSGFFGINGWRIVFLMNIPLGVTAFFLAPKFIEETRINNKNKFDIPGMFILSIVLITFIYPLIVGREYHWPLWTTISIAFSMILLLVFILHQKSKLIKDLNPLINLKLFTIPDFNIGILALIFIYGVHSSFIFMISIYIHTVLNVSSINAGINFSFYGVGFLLSSYFSIKLIERFGKKLLQTGILIMISSLLLLIHSLTQIPGNILFLKYYILLYGLGQGLLIPSLINIALKSIPEKFTGMSAGVYSTMQQIACALGVAVVGGIFYYVHQLNGISSTFTSPLKYGLYTDVAYLIIAVICLQYLQRKNTKEGIIKVCC